MHLHLEKKMIRKEIKHRMIDGIDKSELIKLAFTEKELRSEVKWEHNKEFEYRGEMYDIVDVTFENDKIVYWCWWDHKETALNQKLNQLLNQFLGTSHGDKEDKDTVSQFVKLVYTVPTIYTFYDLLNFNKKTSTQYINSYYQAFLSLTSPPPKV